MQLRQTVGSVQYVCDNMWTIKSANCEWNWRASIEMSYWTLYIEVQ